MHDEQLKPMPVTPEVMDLWEEEAVRAFPHLLPGDINWPMMVRSLIAEIRARQETKMIETKHYSNGTSATGVAPLPAWSSDQQDAMVSAIKNAMAFIEWPAGADRQREVLKALEDVLALFP